MKSANMYDDLPSHEGTYGLDVRDVTAIAMESLVCRFRRSEVYGVGL